MQGWKNGRSRVNPPAYSIVLASRHENSADPAGKESHAQSPNAETRSAEAKDTVLGLDHTPGVVASSVDTLLPTLSSYTSCTGMTQHGMQSNDFSVISQERCAYNDIGLYVGKANNTDTEKEMLYNDTRYVDMHDHVTVLSESFLSIFQALELLIERGIDKFSKNKHAVRKQLIDIEKAIEFYKDDLQDTNRSILEAEWRLLKMSCMTPEHQTQATEVMTVCEVLNIIDKDSFPDMAVFLMILAVIPMTTASVERSFFTLKKLKTCL
ncbi:hypothetical protein PR048_012364 [Dryococelus australis]|uniref:HAT C-terminal dimerisation domain-containing protein n=1 Tax=Dryococelus australis TaxID=614101 RepID=A0ABQ9HP50_9NEOP|nr:hypothetical protein PR048_012364 [Dryococelus australis]